MDSTAKIQGPESLLHYEPPISVEGGSASGAAAEGSAASGQLAEILNSIFPPRIFDSDSGSYMQYVSKEDATRYDVTRLQEQLEQKLMQRQARESGICPVREDLFRQCFDELIRQVCIKSPERGLLLLRVRDEIRMTIDAYKVLYDSSVTFGVRKQLQAEQGIQEMETEIKTLQDRKKKLEGEVLNLRSKVEMVEKREAERRQVMEKRQREEVEFLRQQGKHLDMFLGQMGKR